MASNTFFGKTFNLPFFRQQPERRQTYWDKFATFDVRNEEMPYDVSSRHVDAILGIKNDNSRLESRDIAHLTNPRTGEVYDWVETYAKWRNPHSAMMQERTLLNPAMVESNAEHLWDNYRMAAKTRPGILNIIIDNVRHVDRKNGVPEDAQQALAETIMAFGNRVLDNSISNERRVRDYYQSRFTNLSEEYLSSLVLARCLMLEVLPLNAGEVHKAYPRNDGSIDHPIHGDNPVAYERRLSISAVLNKFYWLRFRDLCTAIEYAYVTARRPQQSKSSETAGAEAA